MARTSNQTVTGTEIGIRETNSNFRWDSLYSIHINNVHEEGMNLSFPFSSYKYNGEDRVYLLFWQPELEEDKCPTKSLQVSDYLKYHFIIHFWRIFFLFFDILITFVQIQIWFRVNHLAFVHNQYELQKYETEVQVTSEISYIAQLKFERYSTWIILIKNKTTPPKRNKLRTVLIIYKENTIHYV